MKITPYLVINHYYEGDEAKENCAIITELKKKHFVKSRIIIGILSQTVLKNDSGFEDDEKLIDHYFKKYKDPISSYVATLVAKAEKYPHIAKQLEKYKKYYE